MGTPADRIETLRARIQESNAIDDGDRERLLDFSDRIYLLQTEYSDHRHEKLLRHCTIIAEEVGGLDAAMQDRNAAERIVAWISRTYDNEETNRDYRTALRVCGARTVGDDDETPDALAWIPTGTSSTYDPTPDPTEMLHWEDHVVPMIEAARNHRDAALVALQWDAGLRGGECKSLTRGQLSDHDHGLQVTVQGKQGRRTVTLIPSVPYVRRWLEAHPSDDGDVPLWSKLNRAEPISDTMVSKILNTLADEADVGRPVTLTNFRKSSAAFLCLAQHEPGPHRGPSWLGDRVDGRQSLHQRLRRRS
jgi:hypothetical protein